MITLENFYTSKAWQKCRRYVIADILSRDGALYCSRCRKEIMEPNDAVLHHIKPLDDDTVGDPDVAYNPDNLEILCHACHNAEHDKGWTLSREKRVYILCGGTDADREKYIIGHASDGALVVSIPRIQDALSPRRKRDRLMPVVWQVRDVVYTSIEKRFGPWTEAWIVGEFSNVAEREALARRMGGTVLNCTKD